MNILSKAELISRMFRFGQVVKESGFWKETLNSDTHEYGGSGQGNSGGVEATTRHHHGWPNSLALTLPPLGIIVLKRGKDSTGKAG